MEIFDVKNQKYELNKYKSISGTEAKSAFYKLREQATDVPEMSIDEINAEISAVRKERER